MISFRTPATAVAAVIVLAACSDGTSPLNTGPDDPNDATFSHTGQGGQPGHLELCKVGSTASFDITIEDPSTALSPDVSLTNEPFADGECRVLYDVPLIVGAPSPNVDYTITEIVPAGTVLDSIVRQTFNAGTRTTLTGTNTDTHFANDDQGIVLTFFNRVLPPEKELELCKVGTAASFDILVEDPSTAVSPDISLSDEPFADGECRVLYSVAAIPGKPSPRVTYTITEVVPAGVVLDSIVKLEDLGSGNRTTITGTNTDSDFISDDKGIVLTFFNRLLPEEGGEGCTPGYWKNHAGAESFSNGGKKKPTSWEGANPSDSYDGTFGVTSSFGGSLMDALTRGGGGEIALGRHAVAAYLNALHSGVDYDLNDAEVIAIVQGAYSSGDFESAKDQLGTLNEQGCPL